MAFFLPILTIVLIVGALICLWKGNFPLFVRILVLSLAMITCFAREFLRAVNYSKLHIRLVFIMDVAFILFVLPLIGLLAFSENLSSVNAVLVLGGGYLFSAFIGQAKHKNEYKYQWIVIKKSLKEAWQYSRWALIGVSATIVQTQGYLYVVSLAIGLEETANMSAARIFLMPVGLCITSSVKIIVAKGAEILHQDGMAKLKYFILSIIGFLFVVWFAYVFLLGLTHTTLVQMIYKGKYGENEGYLVAWAILILVKAFRFPISNSLQVCLEFKALANYGVLAAVFTIVPCIGLTKIYGGYGALVSLILGELILLILCLYRVNGIVKCAEAIQDDPYQAVVEGRPI